MYRTWSRSSISSCTCSICSCTCVSQVWINGGINDQNWSETAKVPQGFKRKFKFQQAFAAHLPRFLLEFEEGGVDHLDRELVGRKSSMEWCWDLGENVCSFITGMTLQLQILLPKFCDLYENPKCAMCKSWLSATCRRSLDRSFDLQLFLFLHLATGCNHECRCKECLAKNEVSPAPPRMPTPPQKRLQRTSETSCNSVQLRSPLCPQWNHVRTKKIQEWNTLDSHHGGLGRCSGMFFCLVFSVGPLWVHAVDCERWCAQPLGCTRHATRGSLEVTMLRGMGGQSLG